MQNGYIENFIGKLRDEKLNETLFTTLHQVRVERAQWRNDYNHRRPHSGLGWLPPFEFANHNARSKQWPSGAVQLEGPAPMAIAALARHGINEVQSELKTG